MDDLGSIVPNPEYVAGYCVQSLLPRIRSSSSIRVLAEKCIQLKIFHLFAKFHKLEILDVFLSH